MNRELLPRIIENISRHEGRVAQMYLDKKGFVTVGVGHLIAKIEDACVLKFIRIDRPATRAEIIADYSAVKYTKKRGLLFLPVEEMDRLLAYDLGKAEHTLTAEFPGIAEFPESVQIALYDMCHQCGSITPKGWPKLTAAVKARKWAEASNECYRPDAGPGRNQDTKEQFLLANTHVTDASFA